MHPSSPSADLFQMYLYGSASAEPFFVACVPGELGSTTAHLRRLPREGRAGGAQNLCSSIACRAQPCQRCSPVLQALILSQYATLRLCFGRAVFCCPIPGELGSTAENVLLKGDYAAKRCVPPFFARQTVLYYNCIGACRKGSEPVRFTQGSVSRARCTEKAVF